LWGGRIKDLPEMPAGSAILELGCGNGKTLSSMLSLPLRLVALDISMEAVKLGRMASEDRFDFLVADASRLPFRDRIFDIVFCFHVAGHVLLPERKLMAFEVARVLKNGGKLFFRDFGANDMRAGQGMEIEHCTFRRGQGVITHYFTIGEVAGLFGSLEPISLETHQWKMRIRGKDNLRFEIEAAFRKNVI
jgi:ubiquinone/menaquinone biosynthesis C-methylase UbiE